MINASSGFPNPTTLNSDPSTSSTVDAKASTISKPLSSKSGPSLKLIIGLLILGLAIVGSAVAFYLMGQNQDVRQQAAGCDAGKGEVTCNDACGWRCVAAPNTCASTCSSNPPPATNAPTAPPTNTACKPSGNSARYCDGKQNNENIGPCTCQFSSLGANDCACIAPAGSCATTGGTCYSGSTCSGLSPARSVVNGGGGCSGGQVCCGGTSTSTGGGTATTPTGCLSPDGTRKNVGDKWCIGNVSYTCTSNNVDSAEQCQNFGKVCDPQTKSCVAAATSGFGCTSVGQSCTPTGGATAGGFCSVSEVGGYSCVPKVATKQPCINNFNCQSNYCAPTGLCEVGTGGTANTCKASNEICVTSGNNIGFCQVLTGSAYSETTFSCEPKRTYNSPCSNAAQCVSNNCIPTTGRCGYEQVTAALCPSYRDQNLCNLHDDICRWVNATTGCIARTTATTTPISTTKCLRAGTSAGNCVIASKSVGESCSISSTQTGVCSSTDSVTVGTENGYYCNCQVPPTIPAPTTPNDQTSICYNGSPTALSCRGNGVDSRCTGFAGNCRATGTNASGATLCGCIPDAPLNDNGSCTADSNCESGYCRKTTTPFVCRPASERPLGGSSTTVTTAMCPNSPTTPIAKYLKFTCPNGCVQTTEGGVTAWRCYENRQESTSPLTMNGACGQVDALSGSTDATYCGYTEYTCGEARCQTGGGSTTIASPTVPPTNPPGPMCLAISMTNVTLAERTTPILGDAIRLTCGTVEGAARYIFQIVEPDNTKVSLQATGASSATYTISKTGRHSAQCQICTGNSDSTCYAFENIASQ